MKKSLTKNYFYNLSYQILVVLTPFITIPYLARVLGPESIGLASFSSSIVSYFSLFASLGIGLYGQREIAYRQDDPKGRSKTFFELTLLRLVLMLLSLTAYSTFVVPRMYHRAIFMLQGLNIAATFFDITWFFQGLEEFGKIAARNVLLRFITVASFFLFIHSPEDLGLYIGLLAGLSLVTNLSLWFFLPRYLVRVPKEELHIVRHLSPLIALFIPQIAVNLYTLMDRTMIGLAAASTLQNGYYEQAEKTVRITLTIVTSLIPVMIPRMAYAFARKDHEKVIQGMKLSYQFVSLLSFPICFGLMAVAPNFVPWFFGPNYLPVIPLVRILSLIVIAIGLSNVTGNQYLVPTNKQAILTKSVLVGAVCNFILNLLFIPYAMAAGAAAASVLTELIVMGIQFYLVRCALPLRDILLGFRTHLFASLIMFGLVTFAAGSLSPSLVYTSLLVLLGSASYFLLLLLFKDDMTHLVIQKFTNLLTHKRS